MSKHYRHLSGQDRIFLRVLLEKGRSKAQIAEILQVHRPTIYREVKRNSCTHKPSGCRFYWSHAAHEKATKRRKRKVKLEKDAALENYVQDKLRQGWSPGQIEGRLKREKASSSSASSISHETIYRYIYSDYNRRYQFYQCLRRQHRYRIKRGQRQNRIPAELLIAQRPEMIHQRGEFGHWEGDLMVFQKGISENFITLVERKTRFMMAIKNPNKCSRTTALNMISHLKSFKSFVKSLTFDQGFEFMEYPSLEKCLNAKIYFCDPGSPHQKGSIENRNGVLRLVFPRSYPLKSLSQKKLDQVVEGINERPMKCLEFLTPSEAFQAQRLS